ncbi:MAG: hypothetical protein K6V97_03810 [Actinomycetia bacterium]|nr:hypothetical protein [Actinomycetes bacterium]
MLRRDLNRVWRDWLAHDLPQYLSRDPQAVPALHLTPPAGATALATVRDSLLTIPGTGTWDLTQYTLGQLAQALQAAGWGATLASPALASLAATALIETGSAAASSTPVQDLTATPWLYAATAPVWQVLKPVADQWARHHADVVGLTLGVLEGPWLDHVGTYLGVPRLGGEPDALYSERIYGLALLTSPNAVSLTQWFAALGYAVTVTTPEPAQMTVTVQWPTQPPQGFVYTRAQIAGMVEQLAAVGVLVTVVFASQLADTLSLGDTATVTARLLTGVVWGGTLPDGTGAAQGFPWNETVWR